MTNKQIQLNIKEMDSRISGLTKEIAQMEGPLGFERKMSMLKDLSLLRQQLGGAYSGESGSNVLEELDNQIKELVDDLKGHEKEEDYQSKIQKLEDITKIRCQLAESKVKSSNAPIIISGLLGIGAMLLVLNYEKTDIVTSKAFSIATKLFRGI